MPIDYLVLLVLLLNLLLLLLLLVVNRRSSNLRLGNRFISTKRYVDICWMEYLSRARSDPGVLVSDLNAWVKL